MKLRTLAMLFVLPVFGLACEESTEPTEEQPAAGQPAAGAPGGAEGGTPAAAPAPVPSAVDACKAAVEAAKAKDDAKFTGAAMDGAGEAMAGEGVKDHVYGLLGEAVCGEETKSEDGSKAQVAAMKGEEKLELAFTKASDVYKLDVAALIEKYPKKEDPKGKGKKGKKDKAKKGKKGKK
ncbi:MAG: hypothetical protein HY903_06010 [Deltaproteobacteria bacterium]|nr:hypothetical protein [Deltaproteobacteria bacterium]